jgi:hypothetical protein
MVITGMLTYTGIVVASLPCNEFRDNKRSCWVIHALSLTGSNLEHVYAIAGELAFAWIASPTKICIVPKLF